MRIFISTNKSLPRSLFSTNQEQIAVKTFLNSYQFDENEISKIEIFTDVYLISDRLPSLSDDLKIDKDTDYLLWHNDTKDTLKQQFGNNTKEGHHIQTDSDLYAPVFKILLDNTIEEEDKAKTIIEKIFTSQFNLQTKLNFLHSCLTPEGFAEAANLINNDWNIQSEFDALKTVKNADPFSTEYSLALTNLVNKVKQTNN